MATEIPVTEIVRAGVEVPAWVEADLSNGMFIAENDGTVELEVWNDTGSPATVSIASNPDNSLVDGLSVEPLVLTIPDTEVWRFGPFRPNTFKQDELGRLAITPSDETDLWLRATRRETARN